MKFSILFSIAFLILFYGCGTDDDQQPVEQVVYAYDTLEYRYQQLSELAIDLVANISMDPAIHVNQVSDLIDEEPVVSLDFRKLSTTRKDILAFVSYQQRIDAGLQDIFDQLDNNPKWRSAPLILELRGKYEALNDSIQIATRHFNAVIKDAKLELSIPADATASD